MQPRVIAILVAHMGAEYLQKTLAALAAQTRQPDALIVVDVASTDGTAQLLAASAATQVLDARDGTTFGGAIAHAMHVAAPAGSDNEWLWLLGHDNAPAPDALEHLLAAVEIAPSVAVAGPKLMHWDRPDTIASFGETMSRFGASVPRVLDELDQGQHDGQDDVLGVAMAGMLIRRSVWASAGGFDPSLPGIDAGLDLCVRARLAGHRVILVPAARVASAGGPERFGRRTVTARRRFRLARTAQLHRRLVYAPGWALALHWLSLVPLALVRALGDLLAKRPGAVSGELRAAFHAAFNGGVLAARRNLQRTRRVSWSAIAGLRMTPRDLAERKAELREASWADDSAGTPGGPERTPAGFLAHGGLLAVLIAGLLGLVSFSGLVGAAAVGGGGLLPLSDTVAELWANIGYGWREIGTGFLGAADPFTAVLAVLGSMTFWAPSFSIVALYLVALPLAALAAWCCARRITRRPWLPAVAALLWAVSPPLLAALQTGRLGAVLSHLLLPWLVLAMLGATRSLAAGASASLLFATIAASSPSLVPALLACWVIAMLVRPTHLHRIIAVPVPALALFAPLIVQQVARGNPLGLLADPGPVVGGAVSASGWHLALADPVGTLHGWPEVLRAFIIQEGAAPLLVAALLAPVGILALISLFLPGSSRSFPAMGIALLGFVTAVGSAHLQVAWLGAQPVSVWPGAGLSLFWLGLVGAAIVALDALRWAASPAAILASLTATALALPLLGAMIIGTSEVRPATTRILPALVTAEAQHGQYAGTLVLTSHGKAGLSATLQRGAGATLDDQSSLFATTAAFTDQQTDIATLAGNLASRSGYDAAGVLGDMGIRFVLLTRADDATHQRTAEALNGNDLLTPVGETANGMLWLFDGDLAADAERPGNTDTAIGRWVLAGQGVVFAIALILAVPFGPRRSRRASAGLTGGTPQHEGPADTFEPEPAEEQYEVNHA